MPCPAKLTPEQVREIRRYWAEHARHNGWGLRAPMSQAELGRQYGVARTTIHDVVSGRRKSLQQQPEPNTNRELQS